MRRALLAVLLLAAPISSASLVVADEQLEPGLRVVAGLAEKDPRVTGHAYYGVHVGRKNIGFVEVDIAPTTSGKASYHALMKGRVAMDGERAGVAERGLLDRKLCGVPLEQFEGEGDRAADPPLVRRFEKVGDLYYLTKDGKKTELGFARVVIHGVVAQLGYLRALDATKKQVYRLCDIDPDAGTARDIELDVTGETRVVDERKLREVIARIPSAKEETLFLLDPDAPPARRVVRWRRFELEYVLAADEAAAKKDLPPPAHPAAGSPRAAILAYLEAVEKRDAKKLEPLIDWPAFQRSLGERGDVEKWKKSFLEQMAAREEHDEHGEHARAEDLIPRLVEETTSPDALDARVRIEGEKGVFKLVREKPAAPWKIASLPD